MKANKRSLLFSLLLAIFCTTGWAQMLDPVSFRTSVKELSDTEIEIIFEGTIDPGWHLYSTDLPGGGPTSASIHFDKLEGAQTIGKLTPKGNEIKKFDPIFEMDLRFFENTALLVQKLKLTAPTYSIKGYLEYGACNDENCTPPTTLDFAFTGKGPTTAPVAEKPASVTSATKEKAETNVEPIPDTTATPSKDTLTAQTVLPEDNENWWTPVIDKLSVLEGNQTGGEGHNSLFYVLIAGFVGGLLALFTPCVWPIIPMTVSFFLKRSKDKKKGIRDAWTYGASIVVIYVALGLAVTLLFGASALNDLSTNAVFNIFFCLLLVVFAASFLGAFEIELPTSWSTKINSKADQTGGLLGIFLMAFTLSLVSFSCTGPIIGFLLVEVSTTDNIIAPTLGMLGFAVALALPFTLFALFPNWLKQMPKSGGWMNVIKVTLGFIELAFALKFLSVADLAYGWRILDREVFLSIWIVLFTLLGFYLLGKIRFPHDSKESSTGVGRFFLALCSLAFAVYMVPGLWGAPLKAVSAFAPPMSTQDFNLQKETIVEAKFHDYEEGMRYARTQQNPVMIDFTGYGCVNCRKMELAVWTDPKVRSYLTEDYVLITLYVDDKTPLPAPIEIEENGKTRTLRTVGDKWSYLQRSKFGRNTQPQYVLLDNQGMPLNYSYSYDEDIDKYVKFLQEGLDRYRQQTRQ